MRIILIKAKVMKEKNSYIGELTQRIYDTITGIQLGRIEGPEGWSVEVK